MTVIKDSFSIANSDCSGFVSEGVRNIDGLRTLVITLYKCGSAGFLCFPLLRIANQVNAPENSSPPLI